MIQDSLGTNLNDSQQFQKAEAISVQSAGSMQSSQPSAWLTSLLLHLTFLLTISFITKAVQSPPTSLLITTDLAQERELIVNDPEDFVIDIADQPGAMSEDGSEIGDSLASEIGPITPDIPSVDMPQIDVAPLEFRPPDEPLTAQRFSESEKVKGAVGFSTTGAEGAIDRITYEILMSMEERKTLVVWFFDQSGSLTRQRTAIHDRIDKIYEELGIIQETSDKISNKRDVGSDDAVLISSVIAFGQETEFKTKRPTSDVAQIKDAIHDIKVDDSGIENVFTAIQNGVDRFKKYRHPDANHNPERNVLFIVFTDEAGNDQDQLDQTVKMCVNHAIPVHIVGAPAPFGRRETIVKWVDPNPEYDQTPRWGSVDQGPESYKLELLELGDDDLPTIDSGFGPYSLTRLAFETSGSFFAVHPNRALNRRIRRGETAPFSAYIEHFFDPDTMRSYRPDYVSQAEYMRRAQENSARWTLLQAANSQSQLPRLGPVRTRFVKRDEATLASELTESQKAAAKLTPTIARLVDILRIGEKDRPKEIKLRWQANYDLAYGQVLASMSRTESYNILLAKAKQGMKFQQPNNNTWILKPSQNLEAIGGQISNTAKKAQMYLTRVTNDHAGTPWAYLAQRELRRPLVWEWDETHTNLDPPRQRPPNPNVDQTQRNRPDDRKRELARPPMKKRPVPKL